MAPPSPKHVAFAVPAAEEASARKRKATDAVKTLAQKHPKMYYQEDITVLVGEEATKFTVHKNIICEVSAFFKAATKQEWQGKEAQVVKLPDVDVDTFSVYMHWLYSGTICNREKVLKGHCGPLVRLYVLADQLGTTKLKNDCIDSIVETHDDLKLVFGSKDTVDAFENTPASSKLRKYIVDSWLHSNPAKQTVDTLEEYPHEFVCAVMQAWYAARREKQPGDYYRMLPAEKRTRCYYHDHDELAPLISCTRLLTSGNVMMPVSRHLLLSRG